jgi:AraC-like DNA-binding protein
VETAELAKFAAAVERHMTADGAYDTVVPRLALFRASAPSNHHAAMYEPSLCVVAQGAKEVLLAGETYRYDPAHSLLVSVDLAVASRVVEASPDRPCLVVRVALDPAVVGELLADGTPERSGPAVRGIAASPVEPLLLDAVTRFVALLDRPRDIGPLAPLVLREITYRLLDGPQGMRLRQIASAGAPTQRIARAIRWLNDHFAEPLRVEALAKHVGLSPSAFHLHFKGVTALSPLQYQKRLRLQKARRLMLGEGIDAAEAAFRVGYESPSQFGREYLRMFGASPRRDVTALKVEVQPASFSGA